MKKQVMVKRGAALEITTPAIEPYKAGTWGGRVNYECRLCAYATLEADQIVGHLRAAHGLTGVGLAVGKESTEPAAEPAVEVEEDQDQGEER